MHKVLIAHSSEDVRLTLEDIISSKYETLTCSNYEHTYILLQEEKPDILILDLSLHGGSASDLLKNAAKFLPNVILATTWFPDDAALRDLPALGVDFVMALPGKLGKLIYRLEDIMQQMHSKKPVTLKGILNQLKIPAHLDGYRMLLQVLPMYMEDPARRLSKEIFPVVAEQMGLNHWKSVDRSIRSAIEHGFLIPDNPAWEYYFPGLTEVPNITQFLSVIADHLTINYF